MWKVEELCGVGCGGLEYEVGKVEKGWGSWERRGEEWLGNEVGNDGLCWGIKRYNTSKFQAWTRQLQVIIFCLNENANIKLL